MSAFIYFPATGEMAIINLPWSQIFNYILKLPSITGDYYCYLGRSEIFADPRIFFNGEDMKWDDLPEEIKAAFTLVI